MRRALFEVCRKEVVENSRDRRSILSVVLIGPVLVPALWAFMLNMSASLTLAGADGPITVPVVGRELAPNLVDFLNRQGIEASDAVTTLDEALSAVAAGDHDVVIVIDDDFAAGFRSGGDARVTIVFDQSRARTANNTRHVEAALNAYAQRLSAFRLQARGISPLVLRPITVDEYDVSTAASRLVLILGVLSYLLVISTLMGGFYLAIDSTAGERERGSLEPLLALPATRSEIMLGKLGATIFFMLLSLLLTVTGFAIAVQFAPLEALGMSSSLDAVMALKIVLIVAPITPLGAALMVTVASFTRSYKEAQTYLGLILLVPTLPLIVASVLSVRSSFSLMLIPSLSQHLLIADLIGTEPLNLGYLLVSIGCTLAAGAALSWVATRLYARERLLG
ncbi:MAG TPA: ABC transporter permease [Gammaproteobacteria bacterium]